MGTESLSILMVKESFFKILPVQAWQNSNKPTIITIHWMDMIFILNFSSNSILFNSILGLTKPVKTEKESHDKSELSFSL